MKHKLEIDLLASEQFVNHLPVNVVGQTPKTSPRKESMTPKIIVCPPVEESVEATTPARGTRLLKALSKRLTRRSTDSDSSESSSSSNDSMSSETARTDDRSSCSASDSSGSDSSERQRRHRSTVSLRRVFQNLNLTSRSQSCSPTERQRPPKKQTQPKRILRPPVTYTYVRGLSGLPTQRVPRHTVCCAPLGLNR